MLAAQPERQPARSAYVFVITPPLYGSTALFALLATSPNVATLCEAGKVNCEGQSAAGQWQPYRPGVFFSSGDVAMKGRFGCTDALASLLLEVTRCRK